MVLLICEQEKGKLMSNDPKGKQQPQRIPERDKRIQEDQKIPHRPPFERIEKAATSEDIAGPFRKDKK